MDILKVIIIGVLVAFMAMAIGLEGLSVQWWFFIIIGNISITYVVNKLDKI